MFRYRPVTVSICLVLFLIVTLASRSLLGAEGKLLVFGRLSANPVGAIRDRQGFVDYIAKKLAPLGITGGKILVVDKMYLLARAIKEGKVDFFHDTVVPTMVVSRWSGSIPILRQWKYGEAEYYSGILATKANGISTLNDLRGKVVAFDEPHSTSAHILPRMLLAENNLKLVQVIAPGEAKPDAAGFVYGSDGSSPNFLITGRVDAAATSFREFEELRPEVKKTLKVIGRTRSVPRLLISVRKDLDSKIVTALREVLLSMDKDSEGQAVLKKQQRTAKVDEIPPVSLQHLKDIERFIFSTLGKQVDSW